MLETAAHLSPRADRLTAPAIGFFGRDKQLIQAQVVSIRLKADKLDVLGKHEAAGVERRLAILAELTLTCRGRRVGLSLDMASNRVGDTIGNFRNDFKTRKKAKRL